LLISENINYTNDDVMKYVIDDVMKYAFSENYPGPPYPLIRLWVRHTDLPRDDAWCAGE